MSSLAERNRKAILQQLQGDPRLDGDKVLSAAALLRGSFVMLVVAGIVGAFLGQILFGEGGLQFGLGLVFGYVVYIAYQLATMGEPRTIGAMAVLTNKKLSLLGSRRVGIVAEWKLKDLESVDLLRKGNILVMGKLAINPKNEDRKVFFISNRRMGRHLVEQYEALRR